MSLPIDRQYKRDKTSPPDPNTLPLDIPLPVAELFQLIQETAEFSHWQVFACGGTVRDLILKRPLYDLDFLVTGDRGFQLVEELCQRYHVAPATLPNRGTKRIHWKEFQLDFSHLPPFMSLQEDIEHRDFTINSLLLDLKQGKIIDLSRKGLLDLQRQVIRCVDLGEPERMYREDPLRMLRAIRLACQLQWGIDVSTFNEIEQNRDRIDVVAMERVREELNKILLSPLPQAGIEMLRETWLLHKLLPEVAVTLGVTQNPEWHQHDVYLHTLKVLEKVPAILELRWAALLHDIGKVPTRQVHDQGQISFYQHDVVGASMAQLILTRLKHSEEFIESVTWLIENHMRVHYKKERNSDRSIRRLIKDAGPRLEWIMKLNEADLFSHHEKHQEKWVGMVNELKHHIERVEQEKPTAEIKPLLDGHQLQALYGQEPGPWIGKVQKYLLHEQLKNPFLTSEDAVRLVKELLTSRTLTVST